MSYLVIKLSALGDFICALGAMKSIAEHHRGESLILLTTSPYVDLAKKTGFFKEVWSEGRPRTVKEWLVLRHKLRKGEFKRVYDLQTSGRSSLYYPLFLPQRPEWSGIAWGCSHPHANLRRDFMHTYDRQKEQLQMAGISHCFDPDLSFLKEEVNIEGLKAPFVLLIPGSSPTALHKRWPYYGELAVSLVKNGLQPVIVGGERDLGEHIYTICPQALNLTGKTTFSDIVSLAYQAAGAVGNDTGPIHMIAPTGCPSVVLFSGKTNPKLCGPWGPRVTILQENCLEDLPPSKVYETFMNLGINKQN